MTGSRAGTVPPPVPPGAPDAWYAPTIRDQYAVDQGVVATVRDGPDGFEYDVREPPRSAADDRAIERVSEYLEAVDIEVPRTREGVVERVHDGLPRIHAAVVERFTDLAPSARRRVTYHLVAALHGFGTLTALALDENIRVADADGEELLVHTADFAPVRTGIDSDVRHLDRFMSERIAAYDVSFLERSIPVTVYRSNVLGGETFDAVYHVRSPVRLPGDDDHVAAVESRIVEESVGPLLADRVKYVEQRARRLLRRRLLTSSPGTAIGQLKVRVRGLLSTVGLVSPPLEKGGFGDRIEDLVTLVLRDLVGEDTLTVPIRDPNVERVEVNRVGERVKVVPTLNAFGTATRIPTTMSIDDERRFVTLATRLAGTGGVELGPETPHASVIIEPTPGTPVSCTVGLPADSTHAPYISIDKRGVDPATPVELVDAGVVDSTLVALLWLAIERQQSVAVVGPERSRPTALIEAHAPFIPYEQRPVTITDGTQTISLPHETGIDLRASTLEAASAPNDRDLVPDVSVMTDVSGEAGFEHLSTVLGDGGGLLASATAGGFETFAHRAVRTGMTVPVFESFDLVVVTDTDDGRPTVTSVVMPVDDDVAGAKTVQLGSGRTISYRRLDGRGAADDASFDQYFDALATNLGGTPADVSAEYDRLHRYVRYLVASETTDMDDLFSFLADLRTDEAATVERITRALAE